MFANVAVVALSALTVVSATTSNWTIDINQVSVSQRNGWCGAQLSACDQICSPASQNTCDFNTLNYVCECSDGSDPKLGQYINTIDFFTCQEAFTECNLANVGSKTGQDNCTTSIKANCGTKDPAKKEAGSGSAKSSSSANSPSATGGSSTASQTATSSEKPKSAGVSMSAVSYLGNGAAALAIFAFAYMI
ncbi:hypothetical protein PG984_002444 [Apiospora sp. TS-2023a]